MSQLYGYVRVSTREQNEARQIIALHQFCVPDERIYLDKQSGKDFNRPAYKRLLRTLRPGDVLAVQSIDRLGRNYEEILEQWRLLTKKKGVAMVVLDMTQFCLWTPHRGTAVVQPFRCSTCSTQRTKLTRPKQSNIYRSSLPVSFRP